MNDTENKLRILVVEDESAIAEVCLRALTTEGYEVRVAVNGDEAQKMLAKEEYHLCLIDIRTPVMNGKQLYQVILDKHPGLVSGVVFTTGDVDDYTRRFLEMTGRPFLPKPFTPAELRGIVSQILGRLADDGGDGNSSYR